MTTLFHSQKEKRIAEQQHLAAGKRRRKLIEALTGYLFVLPAAVATFVFGLWPVIAGFYESLKSGSPLTNKYVGLGNYVRALGSLTYILLFALSLTFIYLGYRSWRSAYSRWKTSEEGILWVYILPGLLAGAGFVVLGFNLVTSYDGLGWLPAVLILLALGGFFTADQIQSPLDERRRRILIRGWLIIIGIGITWVAGPQLISAIGLGTLGWIVVLALLAFLIYRLLPILARIQTMHYISAMLAMGTFMLLAILLGRFTVAQMENSVKGAREISTLIFNQTVLDAKIDVPQDNARINNLQVPEDVVVQVVVNGETIEAPLAPDAFPDISADKITALQTALANNQKVKVTLPDGTEAEGQITGLGMGQKLPVELSANNPQVVEEQSIYSALNVGENVIRAGGHTEPLQKQFLAAMAVFLSIGTIYLMTRTRQQVDNEEHPRIHYWLHIGRILLGIAVFFLFLYLVGAIELNRQAAEGMAALSSDQFQRAYKFVTNENPSPTLRPEVLRAQLLYWPQTFLVATGALLIGIAYLVWQSAQKRETTIGFGLTIMLAILMMVGGWLAISELPRTIGMAGREAQDTFDATMRTVMYSIGTVPVQLALGLFLAYLLFAEISWGKSLYRVIYFMPYIAPSVATSTVFLVIFSLNQHSLANQALGVLGVEPLRWLKEPTGIFRIFYQYALGGNPLSIPSALQGPSLALFTVILYNIWVFAGYNTVVFLAGLGAIPAELYEAAEVDGASRWSRFRNVTLPLLSPTTFFLSMLSIIGTFKAFSHIYVLRSQAAGKEIDTMSVHIFVNLYSANDPGYAAALAFTLFGMILVLTLVQNRLARGQVFYG